MMAEVLAAAVMALGVVGGPIALAYFERRLDAIDQLGKSNHKLLNSNMSAALEGELDARSRELVTMRELVELRKGLGQEPSPATLAAITANETEIHRLQTTIDDRG